MSNVVVGNNAILPVARPSSTVMIATEESATVIFVSKASIGLNNEVFRYIVTPIKLNREKKKVGLHTRIAMRVTDKDARLKILHLKLTKL